MDKAKSKKSADGFRVERQFFDESTNDEENINQIINGFDNYMLRKF